MKDAAAALDDAQAMRHADRELLSLALMQARNRTLAWLSLLERIEAARWLAGRAGWWQERWIARNVQRSRGAAADTTQAALASIEPQADAWWGHSGASAGAEPPALRAYLEATLETTLELLAAASDDDGALHWYRAALFEEDALVLRFASIAQHQRIDATPLLPPRALHPVRAPIWFAAQRWRLGTMPGGFVPAAERSQPDAQDESLPEFEIDAQPVTWQQFAQFVEDGGYDDPRCWSDDGAAWLRTQERRTPREVEQVRGGVVLQRFGRLVRAPAGEAASMLAWYEADAWCRWAGRRLPTEIEWELAASRGASRGFAWADVPEWSLGRARVSAGGQPTGDASMRVQRGVAWFEPRRLAHPKARRFAAAQDDSGFAGFRSVAA
jgi:formylglycine-generating enzyme required for sulfatase activity